MNTSDPLVNAWLLLSEDQPTGTTYRSANSSFQRLIQNNGYRAVDNLNLSFFTSHPTSSTTVPKGNGDFYTISTYPNRHPPDAITAPTDHDYMLWILRDARAQNPNLKIAVTLDYNGRENGGHEIENIFLNTKHSDEENAEHFAANLMTYLTTYNLDGFDIDWEPPVSEITTQDHFRVLVNAIGAAFRAQSNKHYYLTLSPDEVGNLDAGAVNGNMDFINLQLYSGLDPNDFIQAGVNANLFAYGAKFEADNPGAKPNDRGRQTAQEAFADNQNNRHYSIFTCWRLNSGNYMFEQDQQKALYRMVHAAGAGKERAAS